MRDSDLDRAGAMGTYMGVRCAAAELPEHRWVALNTKVSNGLAACLATMDDFPGLHLCHEVAVKRYVSYLACLVKMLGPRCRPLPIPELPKHASLKTEAED